MKKQFKKNNLTKSTGILIASIILIIGILAFNGTFDSMTSNIDNYNENFSIEEIDRSKNKSKREIVVTNKTKETKWIVVKSEDKGLDKKSVKYKEVKIEPSGTHSIDISKGEEYSIRAIGENDSFYSQGTTFFNLAVMASASVVILSFLIILRPNMG